MLHDLSCIAAEIAYSGIDLTERNLHLFSVEQCGYWLLLRAIGF
jgi:hypothetical protein